MTTQKSAEDFRQEMADMRDRLNAELADCDRAIEALGSNPGRYVLMIEDDGMYVAFDPTDRTQIRLRPVKANFAEAVTFGTMRAADVIARRWNAAKDMPVTIRVRPLTEAQALRAICVHLEGVRGVCEEFLTKANELAGGAQ